MPPAKRLHTVRDCQHPRARHQHGEVGGYTKDGCRCVPCTDASRAYNLRRRQLIAFGRWDCWVDAIGTVRRMQALTAMGWSAADLAAEAGVCKATIIQIRGRGRSGGRVYRSTADRVRHLYDRLWHVTPPGRYRERCERHAAREGWAAPWQWEDRDIDDPNATPAPRADLELGLDEVAVTEAMTGRTVGLTKAERAEATRRLTALGYSAAQITERLHVTPRTVVRDRSAA